MSKDATPATTKVSARLDLNLLLWLLRLWAVDDDEDLVMGRSVSPLLGAFSRACVRRFMVATAAAERISFVIIRCLSGVDDAG